MLTDIEVELLRQNTLWLIFALSFAFGVIAQKTNFCTMGALSDVLSMGNRGRLCMLLLATGFMIALTTLLLSFGVLNFSQSIYTSNRFTPLAHLLGGLIFGIGMSLASGCSSKALLRFGSGNLKALVVIVLTGIFAEMTLRGLFAPLRVSIADALSFELPTQQDLPSLFTYFMGSTAEVWSKVFGLVLGVGLIAYAIVNIKVMTYGQIIGAILIALLGASFWWVSGVYAYIPEHPNTLEPTYLASQYGKMEGMSFVAPIFASIDWLTFYTDTSKLLTLGVVSVVGVILGSFSLSLLTKTFNWEGFSSTDDTGHHIVGAAFMGIGGVTGLGCTIGQGLSGLSTLSIGSMITIVSIYAGSFLGLKYQIWRVMR